jgi:hypothetical protein
MGMNISFKSFVFTALLSMVVAGCGLPASQPTTAPALPTASPERTVTPQPVATFTETVPLPSPTSEFAPFCEADAFASLPQCRFPSMQESSTFCSKKNPYTIILMTEGMEYEVLTEDFRCTDSGTKDGMQILTCTGPMASSFEIEACDPSCVVPTVQAPTEKCPQDYRFNGLLGCCTQEIQMLNRNCMTFEFETTSCLVDCSIYTTETLCGENSFACLWDVQNKFCYARK